MKRALEAGGDVNAASQGGSTPLMKVLDQRQLSISGDSTGFAKNTLEILDLLLVRCVTFNVSCRAKLYMMVAAVEQSKHRREQT